MGYTILERDFLVNVPRILAEILTELKGLRKDINDIKEQNKKSADKK